MHEAFIDINNTPTRVMTWGKWIEEDLTNCEFIVLFIPGNPGLLAFYQKFLNYLYEQLGSKVPIWAVGHGGHEEPGTRLRVIPPLNKNKNLYNLNGQIQHKKAFINKYIPENTKICIIGHSIGAYMAVELLADEKINAKVVKDYLLFPTLEYMAKTNSGRFLSGFVRHIVWLLVFLTWFFTCLPTILQLILIRAYLFVTSTPQNCYSMVIDFLHPSVLKKVLFMAMDEMDNVQCRNDALIESKKSKLKLYYGTTDNWAPPAYYHRIKDKYPDLNAELCSRNFEHAFVLKNSKEVAIMVANWIKQDCSV